MELAPITRVGLIGPLAAPIPLILIFIFWGAFTGVKSEPGTAFILTRFYACGRGSRSFKPGDLPL